MGARRTCGAATLGRYFLYDTPRHDSPPNSASSCLPGALRQINQPVTVKVEASKSGSSPVPPETVFSVCTTPTTVTFAVKVWPGWTFPSLEASHSTTKSFPLASVATRAAFSTVAKVLLLMLYSATVPEMVKMSPM